VPVKLSAFEPWFEVHARLVDVDGIAQQTLCDTRESMVVGDFLYGLTEFVCPKHRADGTTIGLTDNFLEVFRGDVC